MDAIKQVPFVLILSESKPGGEAAVKAEANGLEECALARTVLSANQDNVALSLSRQIKTLFPGICAKIPQSKALQDQGSTSRGSVANNSSVFRQSSSKTAANFFWTEALRLIP